MDANSSDPSEIISGLFIGNDKCAVHHGNSFDFVVNCTPYLPLPKDSNAIRIPIEDDPFDSVPLYQILRDTTVLQDVHKYITSNRKVLVHCQAGVQRSPAVVACYLIKYYDMNPEQSVAFIKTKRPIAFFWHVNLQKALQLTYEHHLDTSTQQTLQQ